MFRLLVRIFIKDSENVTDPKVRKAYASLSSIYGICLNIILFAAKFAAGSITASMAIIADAFNNLSDAGSSVITFIGFSLAGKKPDKKHPFGFGRIEYIAGFIVSAVIVVVGAELGISSVKKIISPEATETSLVSVFILVAAILVKLYMFIYNRYVGKKIDSEAVLATSTDSLTDCIATLVTLISMGLAYFFNLNVDGWAGCIVSLFVLYAGITSAIDTISPLLGELPDPELVKGIEETVMSHPEVKGIHDMIVHDYGPGRLIVSLHAEVDGKDNIFDLHDAIDMAESELNLKYNCLATIHMDPIESDNTVVGQMRETIREKVLELYPEANIHDFRMVPGPTHTNLIFDAVIPMDCPDTDDEAGDKISDLVNSTWHDYFAVVHIDRNYV